MSASAANFKNTSSNVVSMMPQLVIPSFSVFSAFSVNSENTLLITTSFLETSYFASPPIGSPKRRADHFEEEEKGADLSPELNVPDEGIDDYFFDDPTDHSIGLLSKLFNENSADETPYKEFFNFPFSEEQ